MTSLATINNPDGRIPCWALFNTASRAFFALIAMYDAAGNLVEPSTLGRFFTAIEVEADLTNDTVVDSMGNLGSMDDYNVVARNELPEVVTEDSLNQAAAAKITSVYPVAQQVTLCANLLDKIKKKLDIEDEEFDEYLDYVQLVLDANAARKETMAASTTVRYMSDADAAAEVKLLYDGGLHEENPRQTATARVF